MCDDCFDKYYERCEDCGETYRCNEMYDAVDAEGNEIRICEDCRDRSYLACIECGLYVSENNANQAFGKNGIPYYVCPRCVDECCSKCVDCEELLYLNRALNSDGCCQSCTESNAVEEGAV